MPTYSVTYRVKSPLQTAEVEADDIERAVHAAIEQAALEEGAEIMISQTVEQLTPPEVAPAMAESPPPVEPPQAA
jgi:hypothetical protein